MLRRRVRVLDVVRVGAHGAGGVDAGQAQLWGSCTVEDILRKMEERFSQNERVRVMDRGMVSQKNIRFQRRSGKRCIWWEPRRLNCDILMKRN